MSVLDKTKIKKIHCLGIGGIGVSGLAEFLQHRGYQVSGSDVAKTKITERLEKLGVHISYQHDAKNAENADLVIYSSAISLNNPEFLAAKKAGVPLVKRGQMLAELMRSQQGIAIAGTHGKTTTTGMLAYAFEYAGLDPNVILGGVINGQESTMRIGQSDYLIAEADESDASFLYLTPKIAVVTNVDSDHLSTYDNNFEDLKRSFKEFIAKVPDDGFAVVCIDDDVVREIIEGIDGNFVTYGFHPDADVHIENFSQQGLQASFDVVINDSITPVTINSPGKHNALNATVVCAIADRLHLPMQKIVAGLAVFPGVGRRFHYQGDVVAGDGKVAVFEDYGHHPREIAATMEAIRLAYPQRRMVMVFQPHRYTRTQELLNEFTTVLASADVLLLTEIYSAGEKQIPGVDGKLLSDKVAQQAKHKPIFVADLEKLLTQLKAIILPDDIVMFQGAGSIGTMASRMVNGTQEK